MSPSHLHVNEGPCMIESHSGGAMGGDPQSNASHGEVRDGLASNDIIEPLT